jgi:hypothetical protein
MDEKVKPVSFDLFRVFRVVIYIVLAFLVIVPLQDEEIREKTLLMLRYQYFTVIGRKDLFCNPLINEYQLGVQNSRFIDKLENFYSDNLRTWQRFRGLWLRPYCPEELKKIRYEHLEQSKLLQIEMEKNKSQ